MYDNKSDKLETNRMIYNIIQKYVSLKFNIILIKYKTMVVCTIFFSNREKYNNYADIWTFNNKYSHEKGNRNPEKKKIY